jgi:hypothetical protein
MGLELYYFVGTLILTVLLSIVYNILRCSVYCSYSKERVGKFIEEYLYNGLIVFFLESTLETSIALSMNYKVWG